MLSTFFTMANLQREHIKWRNCLFQQDLKCVADQLEFWYHKHLHFKGELQMLKQLLSSRTTTYLTAISALLSFHSPSLASHSQAAVAASLKIVQADSGLSGHTEAVELEVFGSLSQNSEFEFTIVDPTGGTYQFFISENTLDFSKSLETLKSALLEKASVRVRLVQTQNLCKLENEYTLDKIIDTKRTAVSVGNQ
jgi:hypothetical protein